MTKWAIKWNQRKLTKWKMQETQVKLSDEMNNEYRV